MLLSAHNVPQELLRDLGQRQLLVEPAGEELERRKELERVVVGN